MMKHPVLYNNFALGLASKYATYRVQVSFVASVLQVTVWPISILNWSYCTLVCEKLLPKIGTTAQTCITGEGSPLNAQCFTLPMYYTGVRIGAFSLRLFVYEVIFVSV